MRHVLRALGLRSGGPLYFPPSGFPFYRFWCTFVT